MSVRDAVLRRSAAFDLAADAPLDAPEEIAAAGAIDNNALAAPAITR